MTDDLGGRSKSADRADANVSTPTFRLRSPLSPSTGDLRLKVKLRPRHYSSGSDDSVNYSQNGNLNFWQDFRLM